MKIEEASKDTRVVYINGKREGFLKKPGVITKTYDDDEGIVMVRFDFDSTIIPCHVSSLDFELSLELVDIHNQVIQHMEQISNSRQQITDLQGKCTHPKCCVEEKPGSNTGNWSPSDDCYWTDYFCSNCKKRWTVDKK